MRNIFIVCSFVLLGIVVMCGPARAMSCCGDTDTQAKAPVANTAPVKTKKKAVAQAYQCPMHPEVTSNKPGNCPKCGMKLEKKSK